MQTEVYRFKIVNKSYLRTPRAGVFSGENEVKCQLAQETALIQKCLISVYKCRIQMLIAHRTQRKMTEIIKLIRYENNERLGSDSFSDQNNHWNSNLSINRWTCKFIASFSIHDVTMFRMFSCLPKTNFNFEQHLICRLQMLSSWTSLNFFIWFRVNASL